ncbi:glycoside hydrolase family 3 protein [Vibrio paucivorans]|uniref:Glycoside hydrolase family 3 C-terminal domain-containing protein n=1 Tax=Vibrio paucivorans TaxID=2829489 RepID=A0A9X3HU18_9VIBR|nr:glycoside hydrolase family 3 N-terminal domain-containing protein [Vibrio paucivorans]MCW8336385.1 glycoside hydrolase family 3 C-terminal domain-containing protein [Vibrio paucivorans]
MLKTKRTIVACMVLSALISGCNDDDSTAVVTSDVPYYAEWPVIDSPIKKDAAMEAEIASILAQMTLEEKVGQMIQPNLTDVTPDQVRDYKLGSLLNGGGAWPNGDKYATAQDWAELADEYHQAAAEGFADRPFNIPFIWATDAVHGHNNVFRATVFPHNIGLGAARNPDLIEEIGAATAKEITATGLDWTFAPTVATPRDYRWGRVYEGYSEDPEVVYEYAGRMVQGLQNGAAGIAGENNVISNVKHWVGDGGTQQGVDRGETHYSEDYLRNIHAVGYFSGLDAGAQVVMTSFNSWHNDANYDPLQDVPELESGEYNKKLHGSKYMVQDVLKDKMQFDGIVVTDWNGHTEINGCTPSDCPQAVIAGNDVFMVTAEQDWTQFYDNVIQQVKDGIIPIGRIDDAVTRILRVKMRANLWEKPSPLERENAGSQNLLGADEHRSLAREAVSQSLVLLKNSDDILPLNPEGKYLITGSAANDITKQTGGWTITWQGDGNTIEDDFPGAQTAEMALKELVGEENVITDSTLADPEQTTAIVVIGEDPYAEMMGDIKASQSLEYSTIKPQYAADLEKIRELKEQGFKVVTVFYSGRPLYVNEEINLSDAFVAAWLPGTEAGGITDVLFNQNGQEFSGKLSYSWPKMKCSTTINRHAPNIANYEYQVSEQDISAGAEHEPLFPYGYGLTYAGVSDIASSEDNLDTIPLDPRSYGCGQDAPSTGEADTIMEVFSRDSAGDFEPFVQTEMSGWHRVPVVGSGVTDEGSIVVERINYEHQFDAMNVSYSGNHGEFEQQSAAEVFLHTASGAGEDYYPYLNANSSLQFDIENISYHPDQKLTLSMHQEGNQWGEVELSNVMPEADGSYHTLKIPVQCFVDAGTDMSYLTRAFSLYSYDRVEVNVGKIRLVPEELNEGAEPLSCDDLSN